MNTYRQVITPDKDNHTIELPEELYGKKLEVIMVELDKDVQSLKPVLPPGKKVSPEEILRSFGSEPDFPGIDEIRSKTWSSKW